MRVKPRVSIVIPAYNEGPGIEDVLGRLLEAVELPCEIVVVVDTPDDTTVPYVEKYAEMTTGPGSWSTISTPGPLRRSASASSRHSPMSSS